MTKALPLVLPSYGRFPLERAVSGLLRALKAKDWEVPGIKVDIHNWVAGDFDGMPQPGTDHRYVSKVSLPGKDCAIYLAPQSGLNPGDTLRTVVIPQKALYLDFGCYPIFCQYIGDNWYDDHMTFASGRVFQSDGHGGLVGFKNALYYYGSVQDDQVVEPKVWSVLDFGRFRGSRYIVRTDDRKDEHPKFLETDTVLDEFEQYIEGIIKQITA